jgi:hypothetical protein
MYKRLIINEYNQNTDFTQFPILSLSLFIIIIITIIEYRKNQLIS